MSKTAMIVAAVVIGGGGLWWLMSQTKPAAVVTAPTPAPTPSNPIGSAFAIGGSIIGTIGSQWDNLENLFN